MVTVKVGNLLKSNAQTLVNTVNTVGVMGKGIALAFKKQYPEMYADYVARCQRGEVRLGRPYLYRLPSGRAVLNFPTKEHWRAVSRLDAIVDGLEYLKAHQKEWGIKSLAVPPLGCGNGQLDWDVIGPTLHRHLKDLDIPVELYAPHGTPTEQLQLSFFDEAPAAPRGPEIDHRIVRVESGWVALVEAINRITQDRFHWPVGRTRMQKIAYFLEAAGVPVGLQHERGSYGPYAAALKSVVGRLQNNGLLAEERLGRMIAVQVGPTYEDARRAYGDELTGWDGAIDRVVDLFARLRTDQTEVAATVHFSAVELAGALGRRPTEAEVLAAVMQWKARRQPPFEPADVAGAIRNLGILGWVDLSITPDLIDEDELLAI